MIATSDRSTDEVVAEMDRTTHELRALVDELKVLVQQELEEEEPPSASQH